MLLATFLRRTCSLGLSCPLFVRTYALAAGKSCVLPLGDRNGLFGRLSFVLRTVVHKVNPSANTCGPHSFFHLPTFPRRPCGPCKALETQSLLIISL
ncbi:hypothetical protein BS47DRAFT_1335151 [Hydnum rufescens UP504]|uniref:Secreted protein n=1 Tax=Hydnum rufescens UP504 TaxID=1448309 RepID=A0A9P6BDR5_9AGAM|nr:hypothetical protein BS47DRAFT_1335151 [Hydnum rufescens UP504]